MSDLDNLRKDLRNFQRPGKAKLLQRFFKTGKGEYGEGDIFLGLMTDKTRSIAKKYLSLDFSFISQLLASKIHEERVVAVIILTSRFRKADLVGKKEIYDFYFENISGINNWDLVDSSAPLIVGGYLYLSKESRDILYKMARSNSLWKKRIGIMATFYFVQEKDFSDALKIAEILVNDKEDLIQKAVGWMLREIGNRDQKIEEDFLKKYFKTMPRTMLRYAIEKFPEEKRKSYLNGKIC
ncbi:DNA alkylation repair protein [Candidatus Shapirobacteria bacterium CG03_land_8_20_14_0_80_39_12]|uniref:DNA alkylation repair protein n=1 Tax=Candidatus Shapirobacteria bacterium CG03_land_8_20_14_0_80_39_12 TaxID=1974879 RepID=A0A2M7BBT5_9BACT|nr:MAG: DNA alkylation repair protein [Candidatus Shapirobacteria bacterium CG03_land_8_20_14_0_80_39_12]